jgi:hypothetical protein
LRSFQKGHKEKQIQLRSSAAGGLRPDAASVSLTQHSIFPDDEPTGKIEW